MRFAARQRIVLGVGLGAAVAAVAVAGAVAATAAPRSAPPAAQTIKIDVRGAVALVTVTRALDAGAGARAGAATEAVVDVALPARSALLDVEVGGGGEADFSRVTPVAAAGNARDAYNESLRTLGLSARALPFDNDTTHRIRAAYRSDNSNKPKKLRYTFSVLLEVHGARAVLAFPASPEPSPPPTDVTVVVEAKSRITDVTIAGAAHVLGAGGASATLAATEGVSTSHRFVVTLGLPRPAQPPRGGSPAPTRLLSLASSAVLGPGSDLVAYAVGVPAASALAPLPERALFLIDRSRSVGPGGLEAEREAARRILATLPPSTRFDVLFFDRAQKRLFPVARTATREAMAALEDEMVPDRLANGTDLAAALRAAGDLLAREASDFSPAALLVVLSDGAVGREPAGGRLGERLATLPGVSLATAVLGLRPNDDGPISPAERDVLRGVAAASAGGGVEREIRTGDIAGGVLAALDTLRAGGEVYRVGVAPPGARAATADAIAPGEGAGGVVTIADARARRVGDRPMAVALVWVDHGQPRSTPLRPTPVDVRWLAPLAAETPPRQTRLFVGPAGAALVEPVIHPEIADADVLVRGSMERTVVRDALSLAFTPRARACYLNRPGVTPADRDLRGRVRLALDLVRGEVGAARVESSTLARPAIESCLREAAYAIEVPRAYRNDEPVTAVLNLVFRPHTPERAAGISDPNVAHAIDMLVEAALKEPATVSAPPIAPPPQPSPQDAAAD